MSVYVFVKPYSGQVTLSIVENKQEMGPEYTSTKLTVAQAEQLVDDLREAIRSARPLRKETP